MNDNQDNKIIYGLGGIIIGLILAGVFYPMMRYGSYGMMSWRNNSVSDQRVSGNIKINSTIDRHFIEQMIPHHDGAIAMANLALEKAKRPEIKALAEAIIKAQSDENGQMKTWYQDWFGNSVSKVSTGMMGGDKRCPIRTSSSTSSSATQASESRVCSSVSQMTGTSPCTT